MRREDRVLLRMLITFIVAVLIICAFGCTGPRWAYVHERKTHENDPIHKTDAPLTEHEHDTLTEFILFD